MVIEDGDEIKVGSGWSWVVAAKLWLIGASLGWLWLLARFSNTPIPSMIVLGK